MSKRLQVLLSERELAHYQQLAALRGLTVAAWVREALRKSEQAQTNQDPRRKLAALERAAAFAAPAPTPAQMKREMLDGMEQGLARSLSVK